VSRQTLAMVARARNRLAEAVQDANKGELPVGEGVDSPFDKVEKKPAAKKPVKKRTKAKAKTKAKKRA
jgi:hypothetical protein